MRSTMGFSPRAMWSRPLDDPVYQLSVADYPAILTGRKQKPQWVGVSNVV